MPYKDPEKRRRRAREQYARNKEAHRARRSAWLARTKESRNAYLRKRHAENREAENAYFRSYYAKNIEKKRLQAKVRYANNKEKMLARSRETYRLNRLAGIRYSKKYPKADYPPPDTCECCGRRPKRNLHLDHCHKQFKFRGWLCGPCNTGLGMFGDSTARLRCAIRYLQKAAKK